MSRVRQFTHLFAGTRRVIEDHIRRAVEGFERRSGTEVPPPQEEEGTYPLCEALKNVKDAIFPHSLADIAERLGLDAAIAEIDDPASRNPYANKHGHDPVVFDLLCNLPLNELANNLVSIRRSKESVTVYWIKIPNRPPDYPLLDTFRGIPIFHVEAGKCDFPDPD